MKKKTHAKSAEVLPFKTLRLMGCVDSHEVNIAKQVQKKGLMGTFSQAQNEDTYRIILIDGFSYFKRS